MRRPFLFVFALLFAIACNGIAMIPPACAAPQAVAPVADKPLPKTDRSTAVSVEHEGTDTLGAKLAFQLKDAFNTNSLFQLTEKSTPQIKLLLTSVEEFPSRPGLASAYSVVWVFSQGEGTLHYLLDREVGLITADKLDGLVVKLAERTDGVAVKYGYLFTTK